MRRRTPKAHIQDLILVIWKQPRIKTSLTGTLRNTHRVVFFDVVTDVEGKFVADVDNVVGWGASTGDVTAAHQTGLHICTLRKESIYYMPEKQENQHMQPHKQS